MYQSYVLEAAAKAALNAAALRAREEGILSEEGYRNLWAAGEEAASLRKEVADSDPDNRVRLLFITAALLDASMYMDACAFAASRLEEAERELKTCSSVLSELADWRSLYC